MKKKVAVVAFWLVLFAFVAVFGLVSQREASIREVATSEFRALVAEGKVEKVVLRGGEASATLKEDGTLVKATVSHAADDLVRLMDEKRVAYDEPLPADNGMWMLLLLFVLPVGIFVLVIVYASRSIKKMGVGGTGKVAEHKAIKMDKNTGVTFKDVAGLEEAKADAKEIVTFLRDSSRYLRVGAKPPKGALLMGPPGTGKTLMAKAIAGEAGVGFYSVSGSSFVEMFVGVGAARVRSLFEEARKNAPCIIFIDEIDAVGRQRSAGGMGNSHDEREQTLNQLLVEMDGFSGREGIIVIAATNRPDILDSALLRPGRFDRRVTLSLPDVAGREAILKVHARGKAFVPDIDWHEMAKATSMMSGADLEAILNEAAVLAGREGADAITLAHLYEARDRVTMGAERRSQRLTERTRRIIAFHEAGHAIVGHFLPGCDPVKRVSIIPRGQALGVTLFWPEEDRVLRSKREMLDFMRMAMGGRLAELLTFGEDEVTSGASNDLQRATSVARQMVTEFGMTDLGMRAFAVREESFVTSFVQRDHSEATAERIDEAVGALVEGAARTAGEILEEKREQLAALAATLLEHETIGEDVLLRILGPRPVTAS